MAPWPVFRARGIDPTEPQLLEHPFPAGSLESALVRGVVRALGADSVPVVVISDPRSAGALVGLPAPDRIFDAYDAWDLSPLYRASPRRVREIQAGYAIAARHADLVVANTPAMAERFRRLGARAIELLPNGAPAVDPSLTPARPPADVVYVGNVQPRLRVDLMLAAADAAAAAGVHMRIVGAIQVLPPEWERLLRHSAVRYEGARYESEMRGIVRQAAVGIIPHVVDEYTLAQDAMKTWDYLAWGLAIVSTSVPPASHLPFLGIVADDPPAFRAGVAEALRGLTPTAFEWQRELAVENSWARRAASLRALIESQR